MWKIPLRSVWIIMVPVNSPWPQCDDLVRCNSKCPCFKNLKQKFVVLAIKTFVLEELGEKVAMLDIVWIAWSICAHLANMHQCSSIQVPSGAFVMSSCPVHGGEMRTPSTNKKLVLAFYRAWADWFPWLDSQIDNDGWLLWIFTASKESRKI